MESLQLLKINTPAEIGAISKKTISEVVCGIVEKCGENGGAINVIALANIMEKTASELKKKVADTALAELQLQYDGKCEIGNTTIEARESGTKYDYSVSNLWCDIDAQIKQLEAKRKSYEEQIQRANILMQPQILLDADTGEQELIEGCKKTSKTTCFVTLR